METPCPAEPAVSVESGTSATSPSLGSAQGLSLGDILLRQALAMERLCEYLSVLPDLVQQNALLIDILAPGDDLDDELQQPRYLSGKAS